MHQLILSELAKNVAQSVHADDPAAQSGVELLAAKVETRDVPLPQANGHSGEQPDPKEQPRVFMVRQAWVRYRVSLTRCCPQSASMVHANIAFGELAPSLAVKDVENAVLMLIAILGDVSFIDFDPCLSWSGACQ